MNRRAIGSTSIVLAIVAVVIVGTPLTSAGAAPPFPSRIAAVGDSITTATDVDWCCVNPEGGNPQYSWSTGTDPAVLSHYQRVLAVNGGTPVATLNAAAPAPIPAISPTSFAAPRRLVPTTSRS